MPGTKGMWKVINEKKRQTKYSKMFTWMHAWKMLIDIYTGGI